MRRGGPRQAYFRIEENRRSTLKSRYTNRELCSLRPQRSWTAVNPSLGLRCVLQILQLKAVTNYSGTSPLDPRGGDGRGEGGKRRASTQKKGWICWGRKYLSFKLLGVVCLFKIE